MTYVVSWTIELDAESATGPTDAARQAWAILSDAAAGNGAATMLVVRDGDTDAHLGTFDMESPAEPRKVRR